MAVQIITAQSSFFHMAGSTWKVKSKDIKVLGAKGLSNSRGHKALVRREASPSTGYTRVRKREIHSSPLSKCLFLHPAYRLP